ncbi:MAG: hypothetical protein Q8P31_11280, partial [Bacillota bacterium]|nr:hypothetical protein [Bacillota bacterium]
FLFSVTPLPGTRLWEMVSGRAMPASVDFRSPAVNLTSLSDPDYARLFCQVKCQFELYNRQMRSATPGEGLKESG